MEGGTTTPRKVMVVVETNSRESAGALEYALSHTILENDTLIILYIENNLNAWKNPFGSFFRKPLSSGNGVNSYNSSTKVPGEVDLGDVVDIVDAMRRACAKAHENLKVLVKKIEMEDGKDKTSMILASSANYMIDILIIGQKRSFSSAILGPKRGGSLKGLDTIEYLIENSKCTCVAVQKKGQKGGYLLNSKMHKNFWLLA